MQTENVTEHAIGDEEGHVFAVSHKDETFISSVSTNQVKQIRGLLLKRGCDITQRRVMEFMATASAFMSKNPEVFELAEGRHRSELTTEVLTDAIESLTTNDLRDNPLDMLTDMLSAITEDARFQAGIDYLKARGLVKDGDVRRGNFGAAIRSGDVEDIEKFANGGRLPGGGFTVSVSGAQMEEVAAAFDSRQVALDSNEVVDIVGQIAMGVSRLPEKFETSGQSLSGFAVSLIIRELDAIEAGVIGCDATRALEARFDALLSAK